MKFGTTAFLSFSALVFTALLVTTSCNKSNSGSGSGGTISGTFGTMNFSTSDVQGVYSPGNTSIVIVGFAVNGKDSLGVQVVIPTNAAVNHPFTTDTTFSEVAYSVNSAGEYDAYTGWGHSLITINSWDSTNHKIAGTFTGLLRNQLGANDSIAVTNGKFSTSYTIGN